MPIRLWIVLGTLVLLLLSVWTVSTVSIQWLSPLPEINPLDRFVIMELGSGGFSAGFKCNDCVIEADTRVAIEFWVNRFGHDVKIHRQ